MQTYHMQVTNDMYDQYPDTIYGKPYILYKKSLNH